jgi:hypothetical protein
MSKKLEMHRETQGPFPIGNIFSYFRCHNLPLQPFQLNAVVVMNDKFGSRSPLSPNKQLERAHRSLMKVSLTFQSMQTITWNQVQHCHLVPGKTQERELAEWTGSEYECMNVSSKDNKHGSPRRAQLYSHLTEIGTFRPEAEWIKL